MRYYSESVELEVSVDLADIMGSLGNRQKQLVFDILYEKGYRPSEINVEDDNVGEIIGDMLKIETDSDRKIIELFVDMWNNRIHIDSDMIGRIRESLVEDSVI